MNSSAAGQVKDKFHKVREKLKVIAGKLIGNPNLKTKGTDEKMVGKFQGNIVPGWFFW